MMKQLKEHHDNLQEGNISPTDTENERTGGSGKSKPLGPKAEHISHSSGAYDGYSMLIGVVNFIKHALPFH